MDERKDGKANHILLYYSDEKELNEILEFTYLTSVRVYRPIVVIDSRKITNLFNGNNTAGREYIHQLLEKADSGTLTIKDIDTASLDLQAYLKVLIEYSGKLNKVEPGSQKTKEIPIFKGRFIFTAKSSNNLSDQFLTWVNCAIGLESRHKQELRVITA